MSNEVVSLKQSNLYANGVITDFDDDTSELTRDLLIFNKSENDVYYTVQIDDMLDQIADRFYSEIVDDAWLYWKYIADANQIENPLDLSDYIGKLILIPDVLSLPLQ